MINFLYILGMIFFSATISFAMIAPFIILGIKILDMIVDQNRNEGGQDDKTKKDEHKG